MLVVFFFIKCTLNFYQIGLKTHYSKIHNSLNNEDKKSGLAPIDGSGRGLQNGYHNSKSIILIKSNIELEKIILHIKNQF